MFIRLIALLMGMSVSSVWADEQPVQLPAADEVLSIAIHPSDLELNYFTPESLKAALSRLTPGAPENPLPFRMRPPQRGVIVLKSGETLFWFTQDDRSLFILTPDSYKAFVIKGAE